jgi:hypothetical protein
MTTSAQIIPAAQPEPKAATNAAAPRARKATTSAGLAAPKATAQSARSKPAKAQDTLPAVQSKEVRAKKPKLVRDSFTIPKDEYAVIETLKQRAVSLSQPAKKSELLRAGLKLLASLSDTALRNALQAVPSIKTGRPKAETPAAKPAKAPRK